MSTRIGRFEILGTLGQGGMAEVSLVRGATSLAGRRRFALKRMRREQARQQAMVDMFLDEARLTLRLDHPHVVHAIETGVEDGRHWMLLPYVDGPTLFELLARARAADHGLSVDAVIAIGLDVADGLAHLHTLVDAAGRPMRLVHRDLSPSNILLTRGGRARVSDFGLASRASSHGGGVNGSLAGSPGYMAPEQILGQALDARADVFVLGVLLYEALAGRHPFAARGEFSCLASTVRCCPPSLSTYRPDLSAELSATVARCLARDPHHRPPSVQHVHDLLLRTRDRRPSGDSRDALLSEVRRLFPTVLARVVTQVPPARLPRSTRRRA